MEVAVGAEVAGFSYVAAVSTLNVARMPAEDYGTEVRSVEQFIAADGPIALGVISSLGRSTLLVANSTGQDEAGRRALDVLEGWGVAVQGSGTAGPSAFSTVVATSGGTRTFFPYLPGVLDQLREVDLSELLNAACVYVDCYEMLADVTERPVRERLLAGAPLAINLGGSPRPTWLDRSALPGRVSILQSSVTDGDIAQARELHAELSALDVADWVVVSAGSAGAVASDNADRYHIRPATVEPRRTQGAGSALSAGLVHRLLDGANLADAVRFGCAAGTAWCLEGRDPPRWSDINAILEDTAIHGIRG